MIGPGRPRGYLHVTLMDSEPGAMPFPRRVPSRICSADPGKEGWEAIYFVIQVHTQRPITG